MVLHTVAAIAIAISLARFSIGASPIIDFQVAQPPPLPRDGQQCTEFLFDHTFGNSFGQPALATLSPPTDCGEPATWAGVTMNMTVTSNGTQFDRLAIISFGGVEIWRTSTPEPSPGVGIIWTYIKDVSRFIPLFSKSGTLQLQLDNLLSDDLGLDGEYRVLFSVTFFASTAQHGPALQADQIIGFTNITSVPPTFSTEVLFPRNAIEAYVELFASGNGNEEFWYFNAADQFFGKLPNGTTFPHGPFREVRLLVDDQIAGVAFPYPVYFTGAITPRTWRPITSYGALDLPTYFIDLTPFIPILTDGKSHNISLDVASAEDDHEINDNWFVSGLVQIITDKSNNPTTGSLRVIDATPFAAPEISGLTSADGGVNITVKATHTVHIEADITTGSGEKRSVVWKQNLKYSNLQVYQRNSTIQNVFQLAEGTMRSTHNGQEKVSDIFQYPMSILLSSNPDFTNTSAKYDHSYIRKLLPNPLVDKSDIHNRQNASGVITFLPDGTHTSSGSNTDAFSYVDKSGNTFMRRVTAIMNDIVEDEISGNLSGVDSVDDGSLRRPVESVQGPFNARFPGGRTFP